MRGREIACVLIFVDLIAGGHSEHEYRNPLITMKNSRAKHGQETDTRLERGRDREETEKKDSERNLRNLLI